MDKQAAINEMIESNHRAKLTAQAMNTFLKSGKINRYMDMIANTVNGDDITSFQFAANNTVYITLYVRKLDGFKSPKLASILTSLEYLNPNSTSMDEYASQYTKEFSYEFRHNIKDSDIDIRVNLDIKATIKTDSKTCERVIIGMHPATKGEPIYKLVCEGEDNPATEEVTE